MLVFAAWLLMTQITGCGGELFLPDSGPADGDVGRDSGDDDGGVDADSETASPDNEPPVASFTATPESGPGPLAVTLDASASSDEDGSIVAYAWDLGDGTTASGAVVEHAFEGAGCRAVRLTVTDDQGASAQAEQTIVVSAGPPGADVPAFTLDGMPLASALLPRDLATNAATVTLSGTVSTPGYEHVMARISGTTGTVEESLAPLCSAAADDPFELSFEIEAALESHRVEVLLVATGVEVPIAAVDDVVAGDVLIVQGQSNAEARQFSGDANVNQGPFLRSFGTRDEVPAATSADLSWHQAEGNAITGSGAVGQWALHMGRLLVDAHEVPVAILNGARGGQPISYFQRDDTDPESLANNYGRLLFRARAAGVDGAVRAILFYQGESDGADATGHHDGFVALYTDWLEDFPSVERVYVTQVRQGCGDPTLELREVQRHFADELDDVSVMSTTGIDAHDGCHYPYEGGYDILGERYAALLGRDLYGDPALPDIDAPNVDRAVLSADGTELTIFDRSADSTLTFDPGAEANFLFAGGAAVVAGGRAEGSTVVLTITGDAQSATGISYVGHQGAGPWVTNARGIGLLAFSSVPIE